MTKKALVRGHDNPDREVNLGIIITPFLDMAFQLLAFFVMVYQPPAFEGQMSMRVLAQDKLLIKGPPSTKPPEVKPNEVSQEEDPTYKDAVLVVVQSFSKEKEKGKNPDAREKAKKTVEGMPLRIFIKTPEAPDLREVATEEDTIEQGWIKLAEALKEIRKTLAPVEKAETDPKKKSDTTVIKLMPDSGLLNKYLTKAMDVCRYAGFDNVGLSAPPDLSKPGASTKPADDSGSP
jgi:biopolymer transport protein ExbD